jgi:FemAB-related protein (PEP-CTERM system-associated)
MGRIMKIIEVHPGVRTGWNNYVLNHPLSTFYHQYNWLLVIEKTYGHKPICFMAIEDDEIIGIFPMVLLKSLFFGKKLISVPFGSYGGPLTNNNMVFKELIKKGKNIADKNKVKFFEIRTNPHKIKEDFVHGFETLSNHFVTFVIDLSIGKKNMWENLDKKRRNSIRYGIKEGLKFDINRMSIDVFYDIYSLNVKRLGTPVHSKDFFINISKYFKDAYEILNVKKGDVIIASAFLLKFKNVVISAWTGALKEYFRYNSNDFLYWNVIEHFCKEGFEKFDFGRTTVNSGVYDYKRKWNAKQIELNYRYYLVKGNIPNYDLNRFFPLKFRYIWKKLPKGFTNLLGPKLRKNIP